MKLLKGQQKLMQESPQEGDDQYFKHKRPLVFTNAVGGYSSIAENSVV